MANRQVASIEQMNFVKQIKLYILDLSEMIEKLMLLSSQRALRNKFSNEHVHLMIRKIQSSLQKYNQAVKKVQNKLMTQGGLKNLKAYLDSNYNALVKQCHQLMNILTNQTRMPRQQDLKRIKQLEQQMDNQWHSNNRKQNSNKPFFKSVDYLSIDPNTTLQSVAQSQLQQQFLAIRLIAYKMYEQYSKHSHGNLYQQMELLRQQQARMLKQVNELKQSKMALQQQESKLQGELLELRKINELVGRRYFIENDRYDTNFTNS